MRAHFGQRKWLCCFIHCRWNNALQLEHFPTDLNWKANMTWRVIEQKLGFVPPCSCTIRNNSLFPCMSVISEQSNNARVPHKFVWHAQCTFPLHCRESAAVLCCRWDREENRCECFPICNSFLPSLRAIFRCFCTYEQILQWEPIDFVVSRRRFRNYVCCTTNPNIVQCRIPPERQSLLHNTEPYSYIPGFINPILMSGFASFRVMCSFEDLDTEYALLSQWWTKREGMTDLSFTWQFLQ